MDRHAIIFHAINNATWDKMHLEFNFSTRLKKNLQLYCFYEWTPRTAASRIENGVGCILFEAMLQHATCVIQNQPASTNDLTYMHHSLILKGSYTILLFLCFVKRFQFPSNFILKKFLDSSKIQISRNLLLSFSLMACILTILFDFQLFSCFYLIFNKHEQTSQCQIMEFIEPTHAKVIWDLMEPLHKKIFQNPSMLPVFIQPLAFQI